MNEEQYLKYKEQQEAYSDQLRWTAIQYHRKKFPDAGAPRWVKILKRHRERITYQPLLDLINEVLGNYNKDNSYKPTSELMKKMNLLFKTFVQ